MPQTLRALAVVGVNAFLASTGTLLFVCSLLAWFALLGAIGVVVAVTWYRHERSKELSEHRRRLGQCVRCGYDLKRNVSGVCPECGTGIEAQTTGGGRKAGDVP